MRYFTAVLALVLAMPAWAQDEQMMPSSTNTTGNNSCNTSTAHGTMDDDPDSPGGDWCDASTCAANPTNDTYWYFPMGDPASDPSLDTDAQQFAAYVKSCASGGSTSTCRLDLTCAGFTVTGSEQDITSSTGQLITQLFTLSAPCNTAGTNVVLQMYCTHSGGSPSGRRVASADAVEWRVTYAASAPKHFIVIGEKEEPHGDLPVASTLSSGRSSLRWAGPPSGTSSSTEATHGE